MSEKNFVAYGDAESILTGYANRIKQSPTTFVGTQAQWNALSSSQKAEYELVDITDDSLSPSGHVDWESNGKIGSKNLLPNKATTQTINGVTFTINSDGSVTANGTATSNAEIDIATNVPLNGNYILSDDFAGINGQYWAFANVDNGARQYILTSKEMPITISNKLDYFRVKVFSGVTANNITFKPMLRLATDSDSTYQPYAMTNKELTKQVAPIDDMNNILGAKNLLPVTMASQVLSGVTFTVDSASGIIGVSGNNSGTPFSDVLGTTLLKPGTYKVTTGQATELNAQIGIAVTNASSGTLLARSWNGTEVFKIASNTQVYFHIEVNVTGAITSTTIYPTCKLASIKDESYVPYAMTNRQLTDEAYDNHAWSVTFNGQWFVAMYAPGMKPTIYLNVPIKPSKALLTYSNLAVQYFNGSSWQNATINACNYNARLNAINISLDGIPDSFVSSHSNVLCSITGTFAIT